MIALTLVLFTWILGDRATRRAPDTVIIEHVSVVDVVTGSILPDRAVLINDGMITAITDSRLSGSTTGAVVVDATGKYLIPGLWDMHVHIADSSYLNRFIAAGVTGVRDMGGGLDSAEDGCESLNPAILQRWRIKMEQGALVGPRINMSGPAVSGAPGATTLSARTPQDAVASVARLKVMGVDFVKVYEKIPLHSYVALADAAKSSGLAFAGHVPEDSVSLLDALNAGQRSIEHIRAALLLCFTSDSTELSRFFVQDRWSGDDIAWGRSRHGECAQVLAAARTHPVWFTPTLVVENAKVAVDDNRWAQARSSSWLPQRVRLAHIEYSTSKRSRTPDDRASEYLWWRAQQELVARLIRSGASILAGTDAACEGGIPGSDLHSELALLVQAGMTPLQALGSATLQPARYFGLSDQQAAVTVGSRADLVLLDGNPLEDISNTRRIHAVVLRGVFLDRSRLDALLLQ